MILTNRARKKIEQYNLQPEDILTVIESGDPVRQTVSNERWPKTTYISRKTLDDYSQTSGRPTCSI